MPQADELEESAAHDAERLPADDEDQMAGLMDGEIQAVEPAILAGVPQADESVDGQQQGKNYPPAPVDGRPQCRTIEPRIATPSISISSSARARLETATRVLAGGWVLER